MGSGDRGRRKRDLFKKRRAKKAQASHQSQETSIPDVMWELEMERLDLAKFGLAPMAVEEWLVGVDELWFACNDLEFEGIMQCIPPQLVNGDPELLNKAIAHCRELRRLTLLLCRDSGGSAHSGDGTPIFKLLANYSMAKMIMIGAIKYEEGKSISVTPEGERLYRLL